MTDLDASVCRVRVGVLVINGCFFLDPFLRMGRMQMTFLQSIGSSMRRLVTC